MNVKEIAESLIKGEMFVSFTEAKELARAYLELEKKLSLEQQDRESEKREFKVFKDAAENEITKLKKSREVLRKFVDHCCSWNEGEVVTGRFDSPWTAREAREAIKADDEIMKGE